MLQSCYRKVTIHQVVERNPHAVLLLGGAVVNIYKK